MTEPIDNSGDYSEFSEPRVVQIPHELAGQRLDQALASLFTDYSRTRIKGWIDDNRVTVDGKIASPRLKMYGGETISVEIPALPEDQSFVAEPIEFPVVYEDDAILVIDKPCGLVVHPAAGNWSGTLLNGLLHYAPQLAHIPRAGIVHRLDKDTSGLMVVAKTIGAQTDLVRQLQARTVKRVYRAIADGVVAHDGVIDVPIGRDPNNRLRMAVVHFGGKPSVTHVRVLQRFATHSYIECRLETGRTHQIRVHMKKAGHPLAGDPTYGNPRHASGTDIADAVRALGRQALHACELSLVHPVTGETMSWKSRLPADLRALLAALRGDVEQPNPDFQEDDEEWDDEDDDGDWEVIYTRD